jgi:hypothetical protein
MADTNGASHFSDVELLLGALDKIAPAENNDAVGIAIRSHAHLVNTEAVVKVRFFFCVKKKFAGSISITHTQTFFHVQC